MAWDDTPPTQSELGAASTSASWDSAPPSPMELTSSNVQDLLKSGYDFDKYNKLSPEEKKQYQDQFDTQSGKDIESLERGAQKGAFSPAELVQGLFNPASKIVHQEDISPQIERTFATLFGDQATKDLYKNLSDEQLKQAYVQQNQQAQQNAPIAYGAGQIVGSAPSAIAAGGALSGATAGLGKAAQVAGNVALGGGVGELSGISQSNAPTLQERAQEALPSAAIGAGTAGAVELTGALTSPAAQNAVKDFAQNTIQPAARQAAVKSLGPTPQQLASLNKQGVTQDLGQFMQQQGIGGLFSTKGGIANKFEALKEAAGPAQTPITQQMDITASKLLPQTEAQTIPMSDVDQADLAAQKQITGSDFGQTTAQPQQNLATSQLNDQTQKLEQAFTQQISGITPEKQQQVMALLNPKNLADQLKEEILDPIIKRGDAGDIAPLVQNQIQKIQQLGGGKVLSLTDLNAYRQDLWGVQKAAPVGSPLQKALRDLYSGVDDAIEDTAQRIDKVAGTDLAPRLEAVQKQFNLASKGYDISNKAAAKSDLARNTGLGMAAGALLKGSHGIITGGELGALSTANSALGRTWNSMAYSGLDTLAKAVQTSPQIFGEFAQPLQSAAARGTTALGAMHFALYQNDPVYRQLSDALKDQANQDNKEAAEQAPQ